MAVTREKSIDSPAGVLGTIATTNATPATIWAYGVNNSSASASMGDGTSVEIDIRVRGHTSDGAGNLTGVVNFHKFAIFRVATGTTPTAVGSVQDVVPQTADAALTSTRVYFDISAGAIQLMVVGVAATTIYWDVFATIYRVEGAA